MFNRIKDLDVEQGLTPQHIRKFNRHQIMKLLYHYKKLTKSELAKLTQLSIPAVSNILCSLSKEGKIEQCDATPSVTQQKKSYRVTNNNLDTVCVYISPKRLCSIVVDNDAHQLSPLITHTIAPQTPDEMLENVIAIIVAAREHGKQKTYRLAITCHGSVNTHSGTSLQMAQAPWSGSIEFKYLLEQRLNVDVLIDNDCMTMALAEKWLGNNPKGDYCVLNIDYGIGSSFLINNEIYRGRHFSSGQIGHTIVVPNGKECGCGQRGCLETLVSLKALEHTYSKASQQSDNSFSTILKQYQAGDTIAGNVVHQSAEIIGRALYNFLLTLDINQIILYGASCQFGQKWLDIITHQTLENPFESNTSLKQEQTQIRFGQLNEAQLLIGVSYLWVEQELDNLM